MTRTADQLWTVLEPVMKDLVATLGDPTTSPELEQQAVTAFLAIPQDPTERIGVWSGAIAFAAGMVCEATGIPASESTKWFQATRVDSTGETHPPVEVDQAVAMVETAMEFVDASITADGAAVTTTWLNVDEDDRETFVGCLAQVITVWSQVWWHLTRGGTRCG